MTVSLASRLGVALMVMAAALSGGLTACSSDGKKDSGYRPKNPFAKNDRTAPPAGKPAVTEQELKAEAEKVYRVARGALEASDFSEATLRYDQLAERYPFTEYATQGELEKIYVLNRDYKPDEALAAAERFLREHPRHPRADYVQYLKGVIQSERDKGLTDSLPLDPSKKDVGNLRKAYDEFSLLIQKYPSSRYNEDARARMMDLRNRIADNEMHVVDFYTRRGAWLAAAKRAEQVIGQYPGAPATLRALKTLEKSYRALGLTQEADDAARTLAAQDGRMTLAVGPLAAVAAPAPVSAAGGTPVATTNLVSPPAAAEAPVQQHKGFFSSFADLFSVFDRSDKPQLELVLPSTGASTTEDASSVPATPVPAATTLSNETPTASPAPAPQPAAKKSNRLIVEINADDDEKKPAEPDAKPAPAETPKP